MLLEANTAFCMLLRGLSWCDKRSALAAVLLLLLLLYDTFEALLYDMILRTYEHIHVYRL